MAKRDEFAGFFGGEAGISTNRTVGQPLLGLNFGPPLQVYYLVAAWCFACMLAMYALTRTPLGRMANAVRDNPERAEFIGYDTRKVRFLQLGLSAFFAGVSGALSCINFEIVSAENVSALRSGGVLLATFIGGISSRARDAVECTTSVVIERCSPSTHELRRSSDYSQHTRQ